VDWNKVFDIPALNSVVDFYTLMGYDYYYAGSPQAGPVTPLASAAGFAPFNLESSVNFYLKAGLPKEKFIVGLPYYGRQWEVKNGNLPNSTVKYISSPSIATILKTYPIEKAKLDATMSAKYYEYTQNEVTRQIWFSDTAALGPKFEYVKSQNLAGIAIWALGMDHGTMQFWDLIERKFTR
jgi:spore germination protein YaaH